MSLSCRTSVRTAYILLAHKNPFQVNAFLRQILRDEEAEVFIHIDKKGMEILANRIVKDPRIEILQEAVDVTWGDFSVTEATLRLLRRTVQSGRHYDFVCLRSGQDLLVKTGFPDYLAANRGRSFMAYEKVERTSRRASFVLSRWPRSSRRRYDGLHPSRLLRALLIRCYGWGFNLLPNRQALPDCMDLYTGSQWFCLDFQLVKYIVDYVDNNGWYLRLFENSLVPDEWFFHTIVLNSSMAHHVANDHLCFMKWDGQHPLLLTKYDIPAIDQSGQFFARKFDERADRVVVEHYEEKLGQSPMKLDSREDMR